MYLRLIYPQTRRITEAEVIAWARDRMIDAEIERTKRPIADGDWQAFVDTVPTPSLVDAIALLEDDGVATFHRETIRQVRS